MKAVQRYLMAQKKILSALRKFISDSEEDEIDLDKRHSIDKQKLSCK